jgi:hypothetical protein
MSRMTLVFSGALLASAFSTQVCAAEVKFDQQTCYTGPVHLIQPPTEYCLGRTPLSARSLAPKVRRFG